MSVKGLRSLEISFLQSIDEVGVHRNTMKNEADLMVGVPNYLGNTRVPLAFLTLLSKVLEIAVVGTLNWKL